MTFSGRLAEGQILRSLPTFGLMGSVQITVPGHGDTNGGSSTAGSPYSTSSTSSPSPTYGGHRPTTADTFPPSPLTALPPG